MTPNRGGGEGGGVLSPCLNKETAKKAAESLHDGVVQAKAARWTEEANDGMAKSRPLPPPRSWALRSPVCLNQGSLNPSASVQMLTLALPPLPPWSSETSPTPGCPTSSRAEEIKRTNRLDLLLIV